MTPQASNRLETVILNAWCALVYLIITFFVCARVERP